MKNIKKLLLISLMIVGSNQANRLQELILNDASLDDINQALINGCPLVNEYRFSALEVAIENERLDVVSLLLQSGADVNYRNQTGETALNTAEKLPEGEVSTEILRLLQEFDAIRGELYVPRAPVKLVKRNLLGPAEHDEIGHIVEEGLNNLPPLIEDPHNRQDPHIVHLHDGFEEMEVEDNDYYSDYNEDSDDSKEYFDEYYEYLYGKDYL